MFKNMKKTLEKEENDVDDSDKSGGSMSAGSDSNPSGDELGVSRKFNIVRKKNVNG
jgi:hypothetical protein